MVIRDNLPHQTKQQTEGRMSKNLLIVAHVPSGNTELMIKALVEGTSDAKAQNVNVLSQTAFGTTVQDALSADGIILFTPENLGYMSGGLKDFFDRVYYPVFEKKKGLHCAVVISAGQDGTGTQRSIDSILTGLRWKQVQETLICRGVWQEGFLNDCRKVGQTMAAGLESGIF